MQRGQVGLYHISDRTCGQINGANQSIASCFIVIHIGTNHFEPPSLESLEQAFFADLVEGAAHAGRHGELLCNSAVVGLNGR